MTEINNNNEIAKVELDEFTLSNDVLYDLLDTSSNLDNKVITSVS